MNASNSGYRVVMLNNSNQMKNKMIDFVDPRSKNTFAKSIERGEKVVYYLLDSKNNIIGVITLDKIKFTDFQNADNNDKVYSFGILMIDESKIAEDFFISEVWNDFINNKGNFIYCVNLDQNFIKKFIENLNNFYNIYYQLNFQTVELIFGPKVEGKKKYLKIKNGKEYKLTKNTKSPKQMNYINAYLRNYPENNPANS